MPDAESDLGIIFGASSMEHVEGIWSLDEDDWLLLAMLADPIYVAELLFADYNNHEYGGCYHVLDYQGLLFRPDDNYAGFPCGRSLGKTESIKARAVAHIFRRQGEGLLLTAPEMIHLKPLCDAVEDRILGSRLVREFLDTRNQKTGLAHRPFKATFADQTYVEGRIPRLSGQGIKGAHVPDMMVDECFPAGTLVLTEEGQRPIEEITIGDRVLTHEGRWRPVTATAVRRREVCVVRGQGHPGLACSVNHPFWAIEQTGRGRKTIDGHQRRFFTEPRFVKAANLAPAEGHPHNESAYYWASPTRFPAVPAPPLPSGVTVEADFWWMLGFYLAEGSVSPRGDRVTYSIHEDEVEMVQHRLGRMGFDSGVYLDPKCRGARVVPKGAKALAGWLVRWVGRIAAEHEVKPWLLAMSAEVRQAVLDGYITGDGNMVKGAEWQATCADRKLVLSVKLLAQSLGYVTTLYWTDPYATEIRGRSVNGRGWFQLRASRRTHSAVDGDGAVFALVREAVPLGVCAELHDLTVEGDHSFVAESMVVSNSQDFPERGWIEAHEAQPLDAPIVTPSGYRAMGDLDVGDFVIGANGQPTEVLDVLDHGSREILRMYFSDGAMVECDEDHLWTVTCNRHAGRWRVLRAREIEEALQRDGGFGSYRQPWFVPHPGVVVFDEAAALPVDPYLLGVALGDGCMRRGSFSLAVGDTEILAHVGERLADTEEFVAAGGRDYRLRKVGPRSRHGRPPLRDQLEAAGVWGLLSHEKFIPPAFLTASVADRLELLRGLIDTDGNVDRHGAVRFTTSSERLALDVGYLVRSLGGRLRLLVQDDKRGYRRMHTVRFRLPGMVPCKLSRKVSKVKDTDVDSMRRAIIGVERAGVKPVRCIEVAAHDGLYLADGMTPTHNTVLKDHTDSTGEYDFTYHFYGVHNGTRDGTFYRLSTSGEYKIIVRTALMRPGWNAAEKRSAAAMYGGTNSPDYRRNILGEAGSGSNAFFVTSRLMAIVDQDFESKYNTQVFARQRLTAEEVDQIIPQPSGRGAEAWQDYGNALGGLLDLPNNRSQQWYAGMDIGLVNDPTVISLWRVMRDSERKKRLQLVRLYELERFREKMIRFVLYKIGWHFGAALRGVGMDITGLGLPIFQAMEDDEIAPQHLLDVSEGYTFNSKVPVGIDKTFVTKDSQGNLRDQYGSIVEEVPDPYSGESMYVVRMAMIEASTRYLRNWVDSGELWLPFDKDIVADMQGETEQRVKAMVGMKRKPAAFHILDSMRAMAMVRVHEEVMSQVAVPEAAAVLVRAPSMQQAGLVR